MMATGAACLARSAVKDQLLRETNFKTEAIKVGSAFKYLYEKQRGLVVPAQLAFHSDITEERARDFLTQLANSQGGNVVNTEQGPAFVFPHPHHVVEELEKRFLSYAQGQIQAQTGELQQQIMQLQAHLNVISAAQAAPASKLAREPEEERGDPWNEEDLRDPWNKLV